MSLGNVKVSVPAGKQTTSQTAWPSDRALSDGWYRIYVHRYYTIKSSSTESKYYDKKAKKYKWKKEGSPIIQKKTWKNIRIVPIKK